MFEVNYYILKKHLCLAESKIFIYETKICIVCVQKSNIPAIK